MMKKLQLPDGGTLNMAISPEFGSPVFAMNDSVPFVPLPKFGLLVMGTISILSTWLFIRALKQ